MQTYEEFRETLLLASIDNEDGWRVEGNFLYKPHFPFAHSIKYLYEQYVEDYKKKEHNNDK